MHIQNPIPNWPSAVPALPDWSLVKSVSNPDTLRVAREAWVAAGRDPARLILDYRHYFEDYPDWSRAWTLAELRDYARAFFRRFVDRTYLERYAAIINTVETFNEHTDTRMVTDKALLRNHLLAEQAMCDVWNTEYRGRVVRSADGGEGLIPDGCQLTIVNGPVGNDIAREFFQLALDEGARLGYHNYQFFDQTKTPAQPVDEWRWHSGRWEANEAEYGLKPCWTFTESGPYFDTAAGWRHARVLGGDRAALVASIGRLARLTNATAAARDGRVYGPAALFTSGGGEGWQFYEYDAGDLAACNQAIAREWRPAPPQEASMAMGLNAATRAQVHAHLEAVGLLVDGPLYQAKAVIDLVIRDRDGNGVKTADQPQGAVVKAGTVVPIWKEGQAAGVYLNRAWITPEGWNVWARPTPPSLVKQP